MEAEINKINSQHQQEMSELKRQHQESLTFALDEARMKHEQVENDIRKSCAEDRESVIEKERKAIRERYVGFLVESLMDIFIVLSEEMQI